MSRRPEGTDGSDHKYREKVETYYQGMPVWRAAGWLLLHFTVGAFVADAALPTIAKVAWNLVPYYTIRIKPEIIGFGLLFLWIMAMIMWTIARPARYNEKLLFVKLTNTFMLIGTALHVVTFYKYYLMTTKQQQYPRRIWKYLRDEEGWQGDQWLTIMTVGEAVIDSLLLVCWGGTTACLHSYIIRKMEVEKRLAEKKKDKGDAAPSPVVKAPKGTGPRARRPGRA